MVSFTKTPSSSEKTTFIDLDDAAAETVYGLQTWLYAETAFDTWVNSLGSNPTEDEKTLRDEYSNYALRIKCTITDIDGTTKDSAATRVWFGCCLQDKSQKGGGYCHTIATEADPPTWNTQFLDDTDFTDVVYGDTTLDQLSEVTSGVSGITMFMTNSYDGEDTNGTNPNFWTATKLQPWPAAAWQDMYRFEKGDEAIGYVHNKLGVSGADRWKDETMALNFSLASVSLSLATVGALLGLTSF